MFLELNYVRAPLTHLLSHMKPAIAYLSDGRCHRARAGPSRWDPRQCRQWMIVQWLEKQALQSNFPNLLTTTCFGFKGRIFACHPSFPSFLPSFLPLSLPPFLPLSLPPPLLPIRCFMDTLYVLSTGEGRPHYYWTHVWRYVQAGHVYGKSFPIEE